MSKHKQKRIVVIGAGSWGTSLASLLVENGHDVTIWARREVVAEEINRKHTNQSYLPGIRLPLGLVAESDLKKAVAAKDVVIFVVPTQTMREIARTVSVWIHPKSLIVHASKGFERKSLKRMSVVLQEELPETFYNQIVALSGPSHAEEVIRKIPTTVVVASSSQPAAEQVQSHLMSPHFRVYTNSDIIGVEVGGALKNIIAIAAGLASGLGFGDNAKAALMTRGLAEIARLGKAMGAQPITFVGLAGVGDLIATCTSEHSRNWRLGYMLSQGKQLEKVLDEMGMVVEGITTTQTAYELSQKFGVEMPITEQLFQVLFHGKNIHNAVIELMNRGKTAELEEMFQGFR